MGDRRWERQGEKNSGSFEPMNGSDIPCSQLSRERVRQKLYWIITRGMKLRLNARTGD